jgi:flagellar biosynthetic protein FliQ
MTQDHVMQIFSAALMTAFRMAAPMLLVSLTIGLSIAILQAATQIHEQTLTFVPKLFGIALVLLFTGAFLYSSIRDFTEMIFQTIATMS